MKMTLMIEAACEGDRGERRAALDEKARVRHAQRDHVFVWRHSEFPAERAHHAGAANADGRCQSLERDWLQRVGVDVIADLVSYRARFRRRLPESPW